MFLVSRKIILPLTLLLLLCFNVGSLTLSSSSNASAASNDATKYCKKFKNKDEAKACEYGYDHSDAKGQAYDKLCKKYKTSALQGACDVGKIAGAAASAGGNGYAAPVGDVCGGNGGDNGQTKVSINIGCVGKGNAALDATFAIIRFLSNGVGLVLIGSLIFGGVQFSLSRGNPQANAAAQNRIKSVIVALFIYLFSYALLNYLIPGKLLQ